MKKLPCEECTKLNLSCCNNPQILFSMTDIDNIITEDEEAMSGKIILKGEIPGMVYIIHRPPDGVQDIKLDYCAFFDVEKGQCSIYNNRPHVCTTYGNSKYNSCPYEDYTEPGELTKLNRENPELALSLHKTASSNPEAFWEDFLKPYTEAFINTKEKNPEYMEFWEKLPVSNFIRNQNLMDNLDLRTLKRNENV